jgi:hypothetical protein
VAEDQGNLSAGVVPGDLALPGEIEGRQRSVLISRDQIRHIAQRRPDCLIFCLTHMAMVLGSPEYIGYRPAIDTRVVELVSRIKADGGLLLVAVKFLEEQDEAWVATAHRLSDVNLTRRIRNGTMRAAREP